MVIRSPPGATPRIAAPVPIMTMITGHGQEA
jgi:hypothetical protein